MVGFLTYQKELQDISKQGKWQIMLLIFLLASCTNNTQYKIETKTVELISKTDKMEIFRQLEDSLRLWKYYDLQLFGYCGKTKQCYIDTLFCFNPKKDRFITVLLEPQLAPDAKMDNIEYLLGEKINNHWFFFTGASVLVPRGIVKGHDAHQPLSYQQLHEIALDKVFSGYLTAGGEINDNWFVQNFESAGWGDFNDQTSCDDVLKGKRIKNRREFFEIMHLQPIKNKWSRVKKDSIDAAQNTLP